MGRCRDEMNVVRPVQFGSAVSPMQPRFNRFNEIYILRRSLLSISGRSTTMASIDEELQDLCHRVTKIKIFDCLNDTLGEILVFNDGAECHYDRGIYGRYLNIQSTLQHMHHLKSSKNVKNISQLANVCIVDFGSHVNLVLNNILKQQKDV